MNAVAAQDDPKTAAATPVVGKKEVAITESAAQEIAKQRAKRGTPNARIRVGVRGGGCTGFTYVFEWADEVRPTDTEFAAYDIAIVVDPKSLVFLGGMTLDFVRGIAELQRLSGAKVMAGPASRGRGGGYEADGEELRAWT